MNIFLNICNSTDFDHFHLCSIFYFLMSSYDKKNNPYIFKNRYHSAFILFWGARRGKQVIFLLCFEQNHSYQLSFAFLLVCISCFLSARLRDVHGGRKAQIYHCCWVTWGNSYLLWVRLIKHSICITRPLKND